MKRISLFFAGIVALFLLTTLTSSVLARSFSDTGQAFMPPNSEIRGSEGVQFLTGPNAGNPMDIALNYLQGQRSALGLTVADLSDYDSNEYYTVPSDFTQVELIQRLNGIPVHNGMILVNIAGDGSIINMHTRFVADLENNVNVTEATISSADAVVSAANHLGLALALSDLTVQENFGGATEAVQYGDAGISRNAIPAALVYSPTDKGVRLAWAVEIYEKSSEDWWLIHVDARTSEIIYQFNYVIHEDFLAQYETSHGHLPNGEAANSDLSAGGESFLADTYRVYKWPVESPNFAVPAPPADARTLENNPAGDADANASPFGWHATSSTNWTTTQGNNVDAQKGGTESNCGATLDCDHPLDLTVDPTTGSNVDAAIDNLFYWNNITHDVWYHYGFDEVSRNFQEDNNGMGGAGGDSVTANAQAPGNCNATFGTPGDGSNPTMNMFICNIATPSRDGDFDNGVIVHEYAHGISNRLTGGASTSCLNNGEQMGEGWSDWYGLIMTIEAGDAGTDARGIGTWLLGEGPTGPGVRNERYSTDITIYSQDYSDLPGTGGQEHNVGEIWAMMLWEMTWALVADGSQNGLDLDIYNGTGGNNLAMQLVTDGMKLQPCSPGFEDGRDAILLADQNLTGGANQCVIWEAFAKRGLGFSASQGSSGSVSDGTVAYDIPPSCELLNPMPSTVDICAGTDAVATIGVGGGFTPPVNMSAMGEPAGTTASFSPNPVVTVPSTTTLTIGNTGGVTAGTYPVSVIGDDGSTTFTETVTLNVYDATPGVATLVAPTNGATNIASPVSFSWNGVAQAGSYLLEVATDAGFTNIVYSANVAGTSDTSSPLATNTTHYWRVTVSNACGTGTSSAIWSFTTEPAPGDCTIGTVANIVYQEDFDAGDGGWATGGSGNTWAWSGTNGNGSGGWHGDDVGSVTDQYLISPAFNLPTGQSPLTLQFWNYQQMEDRFGGCFDGGIIEVSTNGGSTWTQITTGLLTDPYDGAVSTSYNNPIGGQDAWCGDPQAWLNSVIDIDAYAGQTAQFRLRLATDSSVSHPGWDIDDVKVQSCVASGNPSVVMTKTVSTSNSCGSTDIVAVEPDTMVYYCYTVQNSGDVTLTVHNLVDDQLGTVLSNYNYTLAPGASTSVITSTMIGVSDVVNTATWSASGQSLPAVFASDSATVTVNLNPSVLMTKTVNSDNSCGTSSNISVPPNSTVYYCYTVTNTGNVMLSSHDLVDDQLGTLLSGYAYDLAPGASTSMLFSTTVGTTPITNTATWMASRANVPAVSFSDTATVEIGFKLYMPIIAK